MPTPFPALVLQASERLTPHIRLTPTDPAPQLSPHTHLKLENFQLTGSFKIRGALNKLLTLTPQQRARGIVVASTGNHGAAAAYGSQLLDCPCTVFVPEDTDDSKLSGIRSRGAQLVLEGGDCLDSELLARAHSQEHDLTYISPYNDIVVAAGQGSLGVELGQQLPDLERVYIAVGGGGLISGVGAHLKSLAENIEVVGCCPELSDVMARSVPAGKIMNMPFVPTLSDGTAGSLEENSITLPLCAQYVDRFESVSEEEIADSVRWVLEHHRMLVEGAAGVAVAVARRELGPNDSVRAAVVLCGANISADKLRTILG